MHAPRNCITAGMLAGLAAAIGAAPGSAQYSGRTVIVNGQWLNDAQIAEADGSVGGRLPDGRYWYDRSSGFWGPEGGPAFGRVAGSGGGGRPVNPIGEPGPIVVPGPCEGGSCVNILPR